MTVILTEKLSPICGLSVESLLVGMIQKFCRMNILAPVDRKLTLGKVIHYLIHRNTKGGKVFLSKRSLKTQVSKPITNLAVIENRKIH